MRKSNILTGLAAATMSAALLAPAAPVAAAPIAAPSATVSAQAAVGTQLTGNTRRCRYVLNWFRAFNGGGVYILWCYYGE